MPITYNHQKVEYIEGYEHLPVLFRPPLNPDGHIQMSWRMDLIRALPVPRLPRGLVPKPGVAFQPPKFHYGWPYTRKFMTEQGTAQGYAAFFPDCPPDEESFDTATTQKCIIQLVRDHGIHSCTPTFDCGFSADSMMVIALTTNFRRGNRLPPAEDVETIRKLLGYEEPAGWYLCARYGLWDVRMPNPR